MCSVLAGAVSKGIESGLVRGGSTEEVGPGRRVGCKQPPGGGEEISRERVRLQKCRSGYEQGVGVALRNGMRLRDKHTGETMK